MDGVGVSPVDANLERFLRDSSGRRDGESERKKVWEMLRKREWKETDFRRVPLQKVRRYGPLNCRNDENAEICDSNCGFVTNVQCSQKCPLSLQGTLNASGTEKLITFIAAGFMRRTVLVPHRCFGDVLIVHLAAWLDSIMEHADQTPRKPN